MSEIKTLLGSQKSTVLLFLVPLHNANYIIFFSPKMLGNVSIISRLDSEKLNITRLSVSIRRWKIIIYLPNQSIVKQTASTQLVVCPYKSLLTKIILV